MKKVHLFLIILVAIIFTFTLVYLFLGFNKNSSVTLTEETSIIPTKVVEPQANLNTYENAQYGFSFRYPNNLNTVLNPYKDKETLFLLTTDTPETVSPGGWSGIFISIVPNPEKLDAFSFIQKKIMGDVSNFNMTIKKALIDGLDAVITENEVVGGNSESTPKIYIANENYIVKISPNFKSYIDISNQILSTFKFTDTAATATQLSPQIGYIKNIYTQNSKHYIDIDYIQWINDNSLPNGFKIVNDNSLIRTLEVSQQAIITLIDWTDTGMTEPKISFDEFIRVFKQTSPEFNLSNFTTLPFDIALDKNGLVNKISLRYTP